MESTASAKVTIRLTPPHPSEGDRWFVQMPTATVGECRLSRSCREFITDLADGLCMNHWDHTAP
jgi:hypothetical protein